MLSLIARGRTFFLVATTAALALRLFYLIELPWIGGDSLYYADVARNLLEHHTVARSGPEGPLPVYSRLPGYSFFLAVVFAIFGVERFTPVLVVQIVLDLGTCFLVAELARRTAGERAARTAFLLTALCPFLAQYAAGVHAETLAIFLSTLAFVFLVRALERPPGVRQACLAGACLAAAILVRVDSGLLLIGACLWLVAMSAGGRASDQGRLVVAAIVALTALSPLVPWTVRNWMVFERFLPLPPRQAQEPHEHVDGVLRWMNTWLVDEISVQQVYWRIGAEPVATHDLPERAFDNADERERTAALLAATASGGLTPAMDRAFAQLAEERIRRKPLRYCVTVPGLRLLSIWLRPRIDMLPVDPYWWRLPKTLHDGVVIVSLGLLNLFLVGAAGLGLACRRVRFASLFVVTIVARSLFLPTVLPEARYTLECFPALIVLAAAGLSATPRKS